MQNLIAAIAVIGFGTGALAAPLKLIRRHLRRHPDPSLADQVYLHPTPRELALRHGIRKL